MKQKPHEFDQFAENYEQLHNSVISASGEESSFFVELKIKLLKDYFSGKSTQPLSVLDYGCGIGRSVEYIQKYFPNCTFYGVDPSAESIAKAQHNYPTFFFGSNIGELQKNSYDLVFSSCVFHHIGRTNHVPTLQSLHSLLKPGGSMVIFEHNPYNPLTVRVVKNCPFDKGVILLQSKYARRILHEAGFSSVTTQYYFFFPKFLSFLRPLEKILSWVPLGAQYMVVAQRRD